jgi:TonB family protein
MRSHPLKKSFLALIAVTSLMVQAQAADSIPVVNSEDLDAYWISEKKVAPAYPTESLRKGEEGCVAVGFVIEADGTTSAHRAIAYFPSRNFTESAIRAAEQFVYRPSEQNPERAAVFTTNFFTFQISRSPALDERKQKKLEDRCNAAAKRALNTDTGDSGAG